MGICVAYTGCSKNQVLQNRQLINNIKGKEQTRVCPNQGDEQV